MTGRDDIPGTAACEIPDETAVLVAGGGPTGLATAVELGSRGIDCLVVEPRVAVSGLRPRAKTTSVRTMEHFRRWGLADRIREVAPLTVSWSQDIVFATTLLGPEITRFHDCFDLSPQRSELFAESSQQVPQPLVEEVLRGAAAELPRCRMALGWRLEAFDDHAGEVRAEIVDREGARRSVRACFAVGADGAAGAAREAIGASYAGSSRPRPNLTVMFRSSELAGLIPHGPAIQYWVLDPAAPAYAGRLDLGDTWWMGLIGVDAGARDLDVLALIRAAVGAEIEAEVISTDPWTNRMLLCDRLAGERVFLAGDAAHLNPPWGGHGFNTGIGDAVNIGWKLAATLAGWGGGALAASYEAERRPVAEQTIAAAGGHAELLAADFADPRLSDSGTAGDALRGRVGDKVQRLKYSEFHGRGLVLGYTYAGSPIVVDDGTPTATLDTVAYEPSAQPGARLPHAWLAPERSLYDELGDGMALLRLDAGADPEPLLRAARERRVPLELVDVATAENGFARRYGAPLVLVRPDQHVAYRGDGGARDAGAVIDTARGA